MHINDGEIRAYQDQELNDQDRQRLEAHLASCIRCKEKAQTMAVRARYINEHLSALNSKPHPVQLTSRVAHSRFIARTSNRQYLAGLEKEKQNMWNKMTSRIPRPVWIISIIVVVLGVSLAFAPVRAIANSFLGLFRVEKIQVLQVDAERLPGELESSSQLERIFSENVQVEEQGEAQEVSSAVEASDLLGIPVRLPTALENPYKILVQPGGSITFQIDLELVRAVLKDIERSDIELPDSLDGTSVRLDFQGGVLTQYGNCEPPEELKSSDPDDPDNPGDEGTYDCTTWMQAFSPTISAPPDLDVNKLGEAYLQLLGMTREEASDFARNVDWTTTFILPIPRYSTEYQEVQVDGVNGILVTRHGYMDNQYTLLWVKDGLVYALNGPGNKAKALEIAASLK